MSELSVVTFPSSTCETVHLRLCHTLRLRLGVFCAAGAQCGFLHVCAGVFSLPRLHLFSTCRPFLLCGSCHFRRGKETACTFPGLSGECMFTLDVSGVKRW